MARLLAPLLALALMSSCGNDSGSDKGGSGKDAASADGQGGVPPDAATDAKQDATTTDGKGTGTPGSGAEDFEKPCTDNGDCTSGFCIESYDGFVCTRTCLEDCPEGYSCKSVLNTYPDVAFICVANILKLCQPCKSDLQCNGGRCLPIGPSGSFCTADCGENDACPDGYACGITSGVSACLPNSGSCDCTANTVGTVRTCNKSDETGTCYGYQACEGAAGWGACTAHAPAKEVCDGVDNDCDGKLDEDVGAGGACTETNELGTCSGILSCLGPNGPVCSAEPPAPEACNLKDDDCDGQTDEDFLDPTGKYSTDAHCGKCGVDCKTAIAFAVGSCDAVTLDPPACVVASCIAGYYPVNPFTCAPVPTSLCQPCLADGGCASPGAKCVSLADGSYCSLPCPDGQCPSGYSCTTLQDGSDQCVPDTGSCSCDGQNPSLQKSCEQVWQDPLDPLAPIVTCNGVRKCTATGWGDCEMESDACDGVDNDCDGVVDGPWVDAAGKYVSDTNCGVCGNSCLAKPPANATGKCDSSGPVPNCAMACQPGFWDVDQNPNNGCECEYASDVDFPDGPDQNCDWVDGEVKNAIFVSKSGNDAAAGTIDDPVLTIQTGIDRAATFGKRDVYVATGVYAESIVLKSAVGVYGGYSGDFHARDTTLYETAILGKTATPALPAAVNASNLTGSAGGTVLDGFTVFGEDNKTASGSSYAVRLVDCGNEVVLRGNRIFAGDGGDGTIGKPGATGGTGTAGKAGLIAYDIGKLACGVKDDNDGGAGGKNTCGGTSVNGGDGGTAICPDFDANTAECLTTTEPIDQTVQPAENGKSGAGPVPGTGGAAGHDSLISKRHGPHNGFVCADNANNCSSCNLPPGESKDGKPGTDGADGTPGEAGAACDGAGGTVIDGLWTPGPGQAGLSGQNGSGGGGGGAAGSVESLLCSDQGSGYSDIGGSGGGGGSGGCGGTAGTAGTGGGGSFGVLLLFTAAPATLPTLTGNAIVRGNGGMGGHGGQGGTGGGGGAAGNGGPSSQEDFLTFCTAPGGKGGQGGAGGHGGGGGGGCGGVSYGVYVSGAAGDPAWASGNLYGASGVPGPGGLGGASLGNPGKPGKVGWEGDTNL